MMGALYYVFRVNLVTSLSVSGDAITTSTYFEMENTVFPTLLIMWGEALFLVFLLYFIDVGYKHFRVRREPATPTNALSINMDDAHHDLDPVHADGHVDAVEDVDVTEERVRAMQEGDGAVFKVQQLRQVFTEGGWCMY